MRPTVYLGLGLLAAAAQCAYCPFNTTHYTQDGYALIWQMSNGATTIDLTRLVVQLAGTAAAFGGLAMISRDGQRHLKVSEAPAR